LGDPGIGDRHHDKLTHDSGLIRTLVRSLLRVKLGVDSQPVLQIIDAECRSILKPNRAQVASDFEAAAVRRLNRRL
jgi:hypothetical protein